MIDQTGSIQMCSSQQPVASKLTSLLDSAGKFQKRVLQYFRASALAMSNGITDIAKEYFPANYKGVKVQDNDGSMFNPPPDVVQKLSGFICENDYCEQQLGDERQLLTKAAGKISMTAVAGLNMLKHNDVVNDIRSGRVVSIVHLRGKLYKERRSLEGSEKEKRVKMCSRVEKHRAVKRVEVMKRARNRAVARAETEAVEQFLLKSEVEALLSARDKWKVDDKLKSVKDQLKIYRDLLECGFKAVRMSYTKEVPAPGDRMKQKKLTGQALLEWLCGQLLTLMAEMDQVDGKVKPWRDMLKTRENIDWSSAAPTPRATGDTTVVANQPYAEECEQHINLRAQKCGNLTLGCTISKYFKVPESHL
jgi:hypothetical protein